MLILGGFTALWLLSKLLSGGAATPSIPAGTPKAVVVTTLDPRLSSSHQEAIKANRRHYANKHGAPSREA